MPQATKSEVPIFSRELEIAFEQPMCAQIRPMRTFLSCEFKTQFETCQDQKTKTTCQEEREEKNTTIQAQEFLSLVFEKKEEFLHFYNPFGQARVFYP